MTWNQLIQKLMEIPPERRDEKAFFSTEYGDNLDEIDELDLQPKEIVILDDEDPDELDSANTNPDLYILNP